MSIKKLTKEELEAMSYKDITYMMIEEDGAQLTADLFKKIIEMLDLPKDFFETKIGDYYTSLATDKRFILLDNGIWDLRTKHPKQKIHIADDIDDIDEIELDEINDEELDEDEGTATNDSYDEEDDPSDDTDEYKDLVIVDEEELGLDE